MGSWIYDALSAMFGGGLSDEISGTMGQMLDAIDTILDTATLNTVLNILAAVACSFLLLYFYMDLISQASRDMITLEKLVSSFIKLLASFAILIYLPELLHGIITIGKGMNTLMNSEKLAGMIKQTESSAKIDWTALGGGLGEFPDHKTAFESPGVSEWWKEFSGITGIFGHIGSIFSALIIALVGKVVLVMAYFQVLSHAIKAVIRALYSPIAIVQIFDDLQRSSGIKYIKKFLAECITFSAMALTITAASALASHLSVSSIEEFIPEGAETFNLGNSKKQVASHIDDLISINFAWKYLLTQVATIGALGSVGGIINDMLGV